MRLYGSVGAGPLRVGASTRGGGGGNGAAFIISLIVVAPFYFAIRYWYVVLPIVAFLLLLWGLMWLVEHFSDTPTSKEVLLRNAHEQHKQWMAGDPRGTYGKYEPALMPEDLWGQGDVADH